MPTPGWLGSQQHQTVPDVYGGPGSGPGNGYFVDWVRANMDPGDAEVLLGYMGRAGYLSGRDDSNAYLESLRTRKGGLQFLADSAWAEESQKLGLSPNQARELDYLLRSKGYKDGLTTFAEAGPDGAAYSETGLQNLMQVAKEHGFNVTDPNAAGPDAINNQLSAFIKRMQSPLDYNDPEVKRLMDLGAGVAERQAAGAGIQGGMSVANSRQAALNSTAPLEAGRRQLALQGMQVLSNRDIGLREQSLKEMEMKNAALQGNYAARQNESTSVGSVVGGIIGAIPGAILAPYTGGASLGLIGAGAAIGGGIGGMSAGSAPSMRSRPAYTGFKGGYTPSGGSGY